MTKQLYPLTKRPQLIDLNGENVNFKLDFTVQSLDPTNEFNAIVLTQDQLDTMDLNKIEMKSAKGKISGNILANNDKYKNYFLVLKRKENDASPDFQVEVNIDIQSVSPATSSNNAPIAFTPKESITTSNESSATTNECDVPFYKKVWFWVFLFIIVSLFVFFYMNFYRKTSFVDFSSFFKKKPTIAKTTTTPVDTSLLQQPESQLYAKLSEIADQA